MIEELKLLIPLLQSAGEGTFWLVIAMLVKDFLVSLMAGGVAIVLARILVRIFSGVEQTTARAVRDMLRIGAPGELTRTEADQVIRAIQELKEKSKQP